jgi:hypothetical protein
MHCAIRYAAMLLAFLSTLDEAASGASSIVPIRIRGHFPVAVATIDGINVPLIFDLGDASPLVLSRAVFDRIKTVPIREAHRSKDVRGNVIQSPMFKVPQLRIGNAIFSDVIGRLDIHDPSYQATRVGQQGYFGTSLLRSYQVVLDYPHRKMTLIPAGGAGDRASVCKGTAVPFLPEWHGEAVTVARTDLGESTAVWDTGSPVSIIRKSRLQSIRGTAGEGSVTTKQLFLGGTDFGPLKLGVLDYLEPSGSDMFIGYNFFAKHVVCVDFPGKQLLID